MMHTFYKMNGLGNDFVVLDGRNSPPTLTQKQIQHFSERSVLGCDQFIALEPSDDADIFMRIYNQDGTEQSACGNATRCVAKLIMDEKNTSACKIATKAGILHGNKVGEEICILMGYPGFLWGKIPLARESNTFDMKNLLAIDCILHAGAVNIGNPHLVCQVENLTDELVQKHGPTLEKNNLFPEHTNVEFITIPTPKTMRLKVWERGAGQTKACGTGACGAVALHRKLGHVRDTVDVQMDGGSLTIHIDSDGRIHMQGDANLDFTGQIDLQLATWTKT